MRYALPAYLENKDKACENLEVMWKIVRNIAQNPECGRIIFVLDALDECEATEQKDFIERLKSLERDENSQRPHQLKVIVTSRPYWNIENTFSDIVESVPSIRLKGEKLLESFHWEMNQVVHARVSRLGPRIAKQTTREELLHGILATKNRRYLWLDSILKILEAMPRIDRHVVITLLGNLPKAVEDVYDSILSKASNQPQAKRLLQIIVAAARPLRLNEVGVALFMSEEMQCYEELELQTGEQLETTVRDICGLFVYIVEDTVFLIHQSAKKFLLSSSVEAIGVPGSWKCSISMSESEYLLASICFRFLRSKELENQKKPPSKMPRITHPDVSF
jgi:hypothetical protein